MDVPPIIPYALHRLPRLATPLVVVYIASKVLEIQYRILSPAWLLIILYALSLPATLTLHVNHKSWKDRRDAAALGAELPPLVHDKWMGGFGALKLMVSNFKSGYIAEMMTDWSKEYGTTFNVRILFEDRIITVDPDHIKLVLASGFDGYEKGPVFEAQMDSLLGTGVFNSDGDMWKFHRSMTRPFFSKDRISHFELFGRTADDALAQLKARLREGFPVDVQDLASRFTLDSATEFLFGQNVRSLSAGLPYPHYDPRSNDSVFKNHPANLFAVAFGEAQSNVALRSRYGINWPLAEPWVDKTAKQMKVVKRFIEPILKEAVERKKAMGDMEKNTAADREVKEGETLLDHLVNYTDDRKVLLDEILNIMIAGRDTTANSITFTLYLLAQHPHVLRRLREEILSKLGPTQGPTYDDVRDMKYLRAVINEVLRLYPAVPSNVRTSRQAAVWPSKTGGKPLYIPAGTKIPYSVFVMQRRTDLWGPDAEVFDPDRFLDERLHKYLTPNPFIFLPFNAGPRICLGQQFAYQETSFFIIRFLQTFSSITLAPDAQAPEHRPPASWAGAPGTKGTEKIVPRAHLTMYASGGVWATMEEAMYF
ncbi:cytochrome P450 [Pleurotus eryngii]|uniref:Cytochrome P450 n=1 Tax=Pleurotus eryngii TaxID=5323 RepID=A0A9P6A562_PLEER|nr:cytochrome P450 [Pleurotus eryngii]